MPFEEVYTVKQVAEILHVHENTVLAMLAKGRLKGGKLGDGKRAEWRVAASALRGFLGVADIAEQDAKPEPTGEMAGEESPDDVPFARITDKPRKVRARRKRQLEVRQ